MFGLRVYMGLLAGLRWRFKVFRDSGSGLKGLGSGFKSYQVEFLDLGL